jgi:hypothetical protein
MTLVLQLDFIDRYLHLKTERLFHDHDKEVARLEHIMMYTSVGMGHWGAKQKSASSVV